MSSAHTTTYQRLVAAAAGLKVPDAVVQAATAPPQDPQPGQIWRAVWEDIIQLLLITATGNDDTLRVVPASYERYADAETLLLPARATTLEQPMALWWELETSLPWCVLDRHVSELTSRPETLTSHAIASAVTGARWGSGTGLSAAAAEYRAVLTGHLQVFAAAKWVPQGSGGLLQMLRDRGITVQQLAAELRLPPPLALEVWRGQQPLTADQAATLAALTGQPVARILDANPALPPAVVQELNRPWRRSQVKKLGVQHRESEREARLRAAYGIYTLAARDKDRTQPNWTARTDRYFELCLDE